MRSARQRSSQGQRMSLARRLSAEAIGSLLLAAAVVGSGVMAERLAGGNAAVALLANTGATVAVLATLIALLGSDQRRAFQSCGLADPGGTQCARLGAMLAPMRLFRWSAAASGRSSLMRCLTFPGCSPPLTCAPVLPSGWRRRSPRSGCSWSSLGHRRAEDAPWMVAAWIGGAYWFTASTSFANPAITIARSLSDTFSGIRPARRTGLYRRPARRGVPRAPGGEISV